MKSQGDEFWQFVAVFALAAAIVLAATMGFFALAFRSNLEVILDGAPICLIRGRSFDSIAAAQAIGRLDLISLLLTMGGLFLASLSLLGFWWIRREAREEAKEVALKEIQRLGETYGLAKNGNGTHTDHGSNVRVGDGGRTDDRDRSLPLPSEVPTADAEREPPGDSSP